MIINKLIVKHWRNFRQVDVQLRERQFIVGPNASGKSNLLDIFRFLRDIAKSEGGGFQKAISTRGDISKIRSLSVDRDAEVGIEIHLADHSDAPAKWQYGLGFRQENEENCQPYLTYERVWKKGELLINRPDAEDKVDPERLTQTYLEHTAVNVKFREVARFLRNVTYLHLVPQFLRFSDSLQGKVIEEDPFGQVLLERIANVDKETRRARLKKIEMALKIAVPQFEELTFIRDEHTGHPHLQARCADWLPSAGWQREDQFSDGTLRLIGLFWALLEENTVILLEEPELSLNLGIVSKFAPMIAGMQLDRNSQVFISTHSDRCLLEPGIDGTEVLLLTPGEKSTTVKTSSDIDVVRQFLEAGLTVGDIVLPRTDPKHVRELGLLK